MFTLLGTFLRFRYQEILALLQQILFIPSAFTSRNILLLISVAVSEATTGRGCGLGAHFGTSGVRRCNFVTEIPIGGSRVLWQNCWEWIRQRGLSNNE